MAKAELAPIIVEDSALTLEEPKGTMTLEEALEATNTLKSKMAESAVVLYDFRERKGWLAMGHADFQTYFQTVLHMEKSTVYHWMARVEATLSIQDKPLSEFLQGTFGDLLPQESAGLLVRLKSDEQRRIAWAEIEGLRSIGQRMEYQYVKQLGKIVDRINGQQALTEIDVPAATPAVSQKEFKAEPVSVVSPPRTAAEASLHYSEYDAQLAQEAVDAGEGAPDPWSKVIHETATDVVFNDGWLIVRFEEAGRVPVSLKFDVVHHHEPIFTSSLFIRAQAIE